MSKYVALLRAINVGGHTVKMDHLRRLFEGMDFAQVETFIASGNVIFDSPVSNRKALEQQIAGSLQAALGYEVATFIRTPAQLMAIAQSKPFNSSDLDDPGNTLYIAFASDPPTEAATQKLLTFTTAVDEFHVDGCEIYWLCHKKISESSFSGALLEKILGQPATVRNSNTVKKIAAKYS